MRAIVKALVVVLAVAFMAAGLAYGQGGATGAINLTVEDSSGGWVAAADVQVIDARTETVARKVQTGTDGTINILLLPPGKYRIIVNKAGFSEARASNIEVRVTETASVTIALKAGAVTEKLEVTAEVLTINTTSATTGASLGSSVVQELPLATQNYQQLLSLSAGASSELNASAQLGRGNVRVIVNGQREDNNNYLIEGISADDYNIAQSTNIPLPNPDVIQEFKIQTALYDASQGRNGGGNVNAIFKSGGNSFHGDVYEYFRNDVFNANEFFLNRAGQSRPSVKQNIFGASAGGPLGKEKYGYIFVNYQGARQRSALSPGTSINNPNFPVIPTDRSAASIAAAFSTFNAPLTAADIDPVTLKLLQATGDQFGGGIGGFLIPSIAGTVDLTPDKADYARGALTVSKPGKYTDDQFTASWDREFRGGSDKISGRFFFSNSESYLPFGAGGLQASFGGTLASSISSTDLNFPYDLPVYSRFFSVSETHLFSPTLVNDFRFGLVRINNPMINIPPPGTTASDLGIDRPTNSVTSSMYKFTLFGSGFQIGPTPPSDQFQVQNDFHFVDNLSWVKGAHSFRFGGEIAHVVLDKLFPQVFNGQLFIVNTPGGATDWQKLLMGQVDFSFGGGGVYDHQYRTNDYGFYAQDDWKVSRDLTLNLGLRVEVMGAFHDNLCHMDNMDPDLANAGQNPYVYPTCVTALNIPGVTATGKNNTPYDNPHAMDYGPRLGVAWDVFGKHKTTVRGGYGIYYTKEDTAAIDQLTFNPPFLPVAFGAGQAGCLGSFFSATPLPGCPSPNFNALPQAGVIDPTFVPCYAQFQGFNANDSSEAAIYGCSSPSGIPTTNIFALTLPRKFVSPNTQQWNVGIQRSIGKDWVIEVGYTGTHAVHLRETRTSLQARRASVANPVVVTDVNNVTWNITTNTYNNGPIRSRALGINGYSGFQFFGNDAYSHYHSLQSTVSRRWNAGYFQAAYTWSKSTDATSTGNTALNTAFNDQSTLDTSRGLSDFDRPHRLSVTYRYDLPFFSKTQGWQHAVLSNWAVSGVTIFQSGAPFSVTDSFGGTAFLGPGLSSGTMAGQLAPGGSIAAGTTSGDIHQRLDGYLNLANFATAPLIDPAGCAADPSGWNFCMTDFGNLGRNIYRGPHQQNWDFSLIKNIKLSERNSLRFTADFFNVWNHANFGNPSITDVQSAICQTPGSNGCGTNGLWSTTANTSFGKIYSTVGTPRLIQFSLRFAF